MSEAIEKWEEWALASAAELNNLPEEVFSELLENLREKQSFPWNVELARLLASWRLNTTRTMH